MQKLKAGENTTMDIRTVSGVLHVLVHLFTDHVSLIFTHHPLLNRAMPTAQARAYLRFLKQEAAAGTQLWLIEQRAGEWTSAAAVADQAEQDMIDGIAANLDRTAQRMNQRTDVADILADLPAGGWNKFRQSCTRTGKPTSQPMDRILASADANGYIPRSRNATSVQLIALEKRGKVVLDRRGGRIHGAWLPGHNNEAAA